MSCWAWPGLLILFAGGCIPSNVVAPMDRTSGLEQPALDWRPATAADVPGLYRSTSIEGSIAVSVRKLYYYFERDGSFTGTVLLATTPARFEVVAGGRWTLAQESFRLGADAAPARLDAAEDHLRLVGTDGVVVLRRERVQ